MHAREHSIFREGIAAGLVGGLIVALWYLLLTVVWSMIQAWIEGRLAVSERADELSFWERVREAWAPVPERLWGRGVQ